MVTSRDTQVVVTEERICLFSQRIVNFVPVLIAKLAYPHDWAVSVPVTAL